jgi:hypothetical protein
MGRALIVGEETGSVSMIEMGEAHGFVINAVAVMALGWSKRFLIARLTRRWTW